MLSRATWWGLWVVTAPGCFSSVASFPRVDECEVADGCDGGPGGGTAGSGGGAGSGGAGGGAPFQATGWRHGGWTSDGTAIVTEPAAVGAGSLLWAAFFVDSPALGCDSVTNTGDDTWYPVGRNTFDQSVVDVW